MTVRHRLRLLLAGPCHDRQGYTMRVRSGTDYDRPIAILCLRFRHRVLQADARLPGRRRFCEGAPIRSIHSMASSAAGGLCGPCAQSRRQIQRARASLDHPSFPCSFRDHRVRPVVLVALRANALASWWQPARRHIPRVLGRMPSNGIRRIPGRNARQLEVRSWHLMDTTRPRVLCGRGVSAATGWQPIGPMALDSLPAAADEKPADYVRQVIQRFGYGDRWKSYYEVIAPGWERAFLP